MRGHVSKEAAHDVNEFNASWKKAFHAAAQEVLSSTPVAKKQLWISKRALRYSCSRIAARLAQDFEEEARLNKLITHSVKQGRASWLFNMLEQGDWKAVQQFRTFKASAFTN